MKRLAIVAAAVLLATAADAATAQHHVVRHNVAKAAAQSGWTVYDHDSPDPEVGWHNDGSGMRVCHNDCDNPEIPGSGARCHDVNVMGMPMRECVTGNSLF